MMQRLRIVAGMVFVPTLIFLVYYPYRAISWRYDFVFSTPDEWVTQSWVEQGAQIQFGQRLIYFAAWMIPVLFGIFALLIALRILWSLARGEVFSNRMARMIFWMGMCGALSSVMHLIAAAYSPMMLSWANPSGPLPVRFWYSSTHFTNIFYGLAFVLMGWVMKEASRISEENDGFL
ncbi:MAG: DUF2975 domain-containing protein [Ascidiaceihabitans sp.]|nr:DUF2975 domain-containing protein [Ascidiaceihabitans sp.]